MNIEFGCGETPTKSGYKTCDIRKLPGVDYVCNVWDIDKHVEENSVDNIFSRHLFEHLTFPQGEYTLDVWKKILKPGGVCEMMLPNMAFHLDQWINKRNNPKEFSHCMAGLWGWQRGLFDDVWDVHKSGYDKQSLQALVMKKGFRNYESLDHDMSRHLHVRFIK